MRRLAPERLLLVLFLTGSLVSLWQLELFLGDLNFADGICAAVVKPGLPPGERAMRLFRWVSTYDDPPAIRTADAAPPAQAVATGQTALRAVPSPTAAAPHGMISARSMIEHRNYFRDNCGSKAWLLAVLARRVGLEARELRLCDADHVARHVLCEVRIDGAWRVLDPTADLAFRRADGQLATAADLRDPALLAENARRAPDYDLRRWPFTHPERLHFEKVPLIGGMLRRLAARLTGRPAEELAIPFALEQPRLVAAGSAAAFALLCLAAAGLLARRRAGAAARQARQAWLPPARFSLEPAEHD